MTLSRTPLDPSTLPPAVSRVVDPSAPAPARMMAAKGLLPLGPIELALAIYQLSCDAGTQIAETARAAATALPDGLLGAALAAPLDPRVLDFFAERLSGRPALLEPILLNRSTADETFARLARSLAGRELEMLTGNQERLLRSPAIIEAVYFNSRAPMSTVQRLLEMAARHGLDLPQVPEFRAVAASILGEEQAAGGAAGEGRPFEAAALDEAFSELLAASEANEAGAASSSGEAGEPAAADAGAWADGAEGPAGAGAGAVPEDYSAAAAGGGEKDKEDELRSLNIQRLPMAAKIRLAVLGTPVHRAVLVRDANRVVAMAAISAPAVSESEAVKYAANRSLHEDVVRFVAQKKEWQRSYQLKVQLVNNPKCPLAHSLRLLKFLRQHDLRALVRSKNVPTAVIQAAKQLLKTRL